MNVDFRKRALFYHASGCIQCYKYFGTVIDSKLVEAKRDAVCRKQQRSCSRSLSRFHVDKTTMIWFYLPSSDWSFPLVFGYLSKKLTQSISWLVKHSTRLQRLAGWIFQDDSREFQFRPSGGFCSQNLKQQALKIAAALLRWTYYSFACVIVVCCGCTESVHDSRLQNKSTYRYR